MEENEVGGAPKNSQASCTKYSKPVRVHKTIRKNLRQTVWGIIGQASASTLTSREDVGFVFLFFVSNADLFYVYSH